MTDRISHLTVALDQDIREDDLEFIMTAIRMVRHVAAVTKGDPEETTAVWIARERLKNELRGKILDLFK